MASLSNKIKEYAKANGVAEIDFLEDVKLQDDSNGKGAYIKEWNLDIPKPTQAQLDAFEADIEAKMVEVQAEYDAKQYQRDRVYPSIGEQLDMQYWDSVNGTTTWNDAVAKVKADNPKPE